MGFRLRKFLIALALFGAVSTGIYTFTGDIASTYSTSIDTGPLQQQSQQTFEAVNKTRSQAKSASSGIGGGIAENLFILKSVWDVISLTLGSLTTTSDLVAWMGTEFGIPLWFIKLVTVVMVILVAYEIVSLYRGLRS